MRLNAFWIKLIAFACMIVDHAGRIFLPGFWLPIAIGRLSYPLFAWLAAQGQQKTSNIYKYLGRLLLWGCLSQPLYAYFCQLANLPVSLNVLFTLALGVSAITVWKRTNLSIGIPVLLGGLVASIMLNVSGGAYAVATLYVMSEIRYRNPLWHVGYASTALTFITIFGMPLVEVCGIFSSLILIGFNGLRGKKTKLFYLLYPAHFVGLIVLYRLSVSQ
ncbi:MAG: TraX family protein [Synechococcus sp.]